MKGYRRRCPGCPGKSVAHGYGACVSRFRATVDPIPSARTVSCCGTIAGMLGATEGSTVRTKLSCARPQLWWLRGLVFDFYSEGSEVSRKNRQNFLKIGACPSRIKSTRWKGTPTLGQTFRPATGSGLSTPLSNCGSTERDAKCPNAVTSLGDHYLPIPSGTECLPQGLRAA